MTGEVGGWFCILYGVGGPLELSFGLELRVSYIGLEPSCLKSTLQACACACAWCCYVSSRTECTPEYQNTTRMCPKPKRVCGFKSIFKTN